MPYSQYTEAKIKWLEGIISQRLSSKLILKLSLDSIFVTISGSNQKIEVQSNLSGFKLDSMKNSCPDWDYDKGDWQCIINNTLPAPGQIKLCYPLIVKTQLGYKIKYDIFGLIYWMFSRQEEVDNSSRDQHDRFSAKSSHAFRYNYLERPIVDEWLDVLKQVIQRTWPTLKLKKHKFTIKISHDVDMPSRYVFGSVYEKSRRIAGDVLKRGDFYTAIIALLSLFRFNRELSNSDPFNTFSWLMDQSEQYNLKSAFYFICGKSHHKTDPDYNMGHPAIRSLMREIHKRGHEIGLHPSYNTYRSPDSLVSESKNLIKACEEEGIRQLKWGGRMHFLRWRHPTTLYGWEKASFDYDSTLGYADHAGFRCGTCFEYPAFDPLSDKELNVHIRPLVAMDVTISNYMGLGFGSDAYDKLTELKKACQAVDGTFTLLWHNNQLLTKQAKQLYGSLLE